VPKVGRIPRFTSCAFSLLFLFVGVRPDFAGGGTAKAAAAPAVAAPREAETRVVVVERQVPVPVPAQQVLPASEPRQPTARSVERKREAEPAAPRGTKKRALVQKTRDLWNRWKEARG
jgi:hypothetical protein